MTSVDESAVGSGTARGATAPPLVLASRREDLIMVVFGACMMLGTTTDGWAHNNIIDELEGFFTPWHGLLYAGFTASAAWTFWLAFRRRGTVTGPWWRHWPAGYRLGALGVVIFFAGGLGDMAWHELIGVEANVKALLSPSHLTLAFGSVLLLTSPLRSWWADGCARARAATGVASLALGTMAAAIFLLYASPFDSVPPVQPYFEDRAGTVGFTSAAHGVAAYVVTTGLLLLPLLLVHRRRATPGTATAVVGAVVFFATATHEFPGVQTVAAAAALAGALVTDVLLVWLDKARGPEAPLRLPITGALFAALVWSAHLLALHLAAGVQWPPEIWSGTVVSAMAIGALLGGLAARPNPTPSLV